MDITFSVLNYAIFNSIEAQERWMGNENDTAENEIKKLAVPVND
jgi:hypothetical protein